MPEELKIDIVAEDKTGTALKKAGKNFIDFAKTVRTASITALKWIRNIAVVLAGLGTYAIKSAYDFQDLRDKLIQVFGDASKEVELFAKNLAISNNRSIKEISSMAAEFGNLFRNSGYAGKELTDITKKFTMLALGMEKIAGGPTQAMEAIKGALLGLRSSLNKAGISLTDTEKKMLAVNNMSLRSEALFKILSKKFPDYLDRMFEDHPLQAFLISVQNLTKEIGEQLIRGLGIDNFLKDITAGINNLSKSRAIEEWAEKYRKTFERLGKGIADLLDPDINSDVKMAKLASMMLKLGWAIFTGFLDAIKQNKALFASILGIALAKTFIAEVVKQWIAVGIAKKMVGGAIAGGASGGAGSAVAGGAAGGLFGKIIPTVLSVVYKGITLLFTTIIGKLLIALGSGVLIGRILDRAFGISDKIGSAIGNKITPLMPDTASELREQRYRTRREEGLPTGNKAWDEMMNKKEGVTHTPGTYIPTSELPRATLNPFRKVTDDVLLTQYNDIKRKEFIEAQKTRKILQNYTKINPDTVGE